jgi:signal transduction histidine kinase/DNA-binding response OmpR family regulator
MRRGLFSFLSKSKKYITYSGILRCLSILVFLFFDVATLLAQNIEIDQLENKLLTAKDTAKINITIRLSNLYSSIDLDHADSLAMEALEQLKQHDYQEGYVKCYNSISYIKTSIGEYNQGLEYCQKALILSEKIGNKELIAQSYNQLFNVHFKKGENDQAEIAAQKSIAIAEEINSTKLLAEGKDHLGILRGIKGDHTEAIKYFMESLRLYQELQDDSRIGLALVHIGHTFELAGNYNKALEYLKKALVINIKTGNKLNEGWTLVNIGVTYSRRSELDTALVYYKRSLKISEEINDHRLILTNLDNIGGIYSLEKDFEKANLYLLKANKLSEQSGPNSRSAAITGNLAENYLYMDQLDSAKKFGEKQLMLALASNIMSEQKVAYYVLAQIYDSLGDYKSATRVLQEYIVVNDSIFNRQKSEQIEELRESYEAEIKEKEIVDLTEEKKITESQRKIYFLIAAIVLLVLVGLYFNQRLRTRRNWQLLEKEKEVDRLKSNFFANVSHEFRTPLTLILGPIESMLEKIDNPDHQYQLGLMQRSALRLLRLINQILDLSKLESGQLELEVKEINLANLIKGVTGSFQSLADSKDIELKCEVSDAEIRLYGDQGHIETIFINLISNAFKFSDTGGRITVRLSKNDTGEVVLQVIDNGVGIPSEQVEQIFNRFYQAGSASTNQYEGTGIGLALTKELVELHSGTIHVTSELGKGTEVTVRMPLGNDHLKKEHIDTEKSQNMEENAYPEVFSMPTQLENADTMEVNGGEKPIVLLIEDNEDVRNYIKSILDSKYILYEAEDGEKGVEKAKSVIPDLIISDVMMPNMNGYEACKILKQDELTSHIPVILLTAKASINSRIEGLETEADLYLNKPFVPKELLLCIHNLINSRKKLRERYNRKVVLKPADIAINSVDELFLQRLLKLLEEFHHDEHFSVEQLSKEIGMSRSQLHRKLQALTSQTPSQFIRSFRLQRAMELLKKNHASVSEIAYLVGFASHSYFNKCFLTHYGSTPSSVIESSMDSGDKK